MLLNSGEANPPSACARTTPDVFFNSRKAVSYLKSVFFSTHINVEQHLAKKRADLT